jgi:hydroxypyruvate isomerase
MNRREFLAGALSAGAAAGLTIASPAQAQEVGANRSAGRRAFKLKYAPHFGMFRQHAGEDPVDQLKYMADQGFTALEDNGMAGRPKEEQERIAREMARLNMTMGVFVAYADFGATSFVLNKPEVRTMLVDKMKAAVEVAKRVNAAWCTVVPGQYEPRMEWGYQTANAIDNLKACAEVCEPAGLVMVLEPLNPRDHPTLFLTKIAQAFQICRAVGSPSCKILNDLYHQQVTEGNLIPNIDAAWNEIAYFQLGDNPGRREPGTGEINYRNIFRHIHAKGFDGLLGMEHGVAGEGKEGEQALLDAYAACDSF